MDSSKTKLSPDDTAIYEGIFSSASEGILVVEREDEDTYRYVRVNPAVGEMTGIDANEICGSRPEDVFQPEMAERLKQLYREVIDSRQSQVVTHENPTPKGTLHTHTQLDPITLPDGSTGVLVVGTDITDLVELQNQVERDREAYRELYCAAGRTDLELEDKLIRLLEVGVERLQLPIGFVTSVHGETQTILHAVGQHPEITTGKQVPLEEAYCRKTLQEENGFLSLADAESAGWAQDPAYQRFGLECYIGTALEYYGPTEGTLCFADCSTRTLDFDESERTFVELLGQWISGEFHRARLIEQLVEKSRTDGMTDLPNHEELFRRLREEMERAERYGSDVSFMMLDLDHFRRVNDKYGHRTGDGILAEVAGLLEDEIRSVDTAGRYGGEEFGIILPETSLAKARKVAKRINERIRNTEFEATDSEVINITCSIGVSERHDGEKSLEAIVERADKNLYAAKDSGRDRVKSDAARGE